MNVELRDFHLAIASQFATYRNNPKIWDNGYDKVPHPFTLKDATAFITQQIDKTPA
ncbi:MAG: hypothetical protein AB8G86_29015 [Saprospiraceae bacterium]